MKTLNQVETNKTYIIQDYFGNLSKDLQRLIEMGFTKGQKIKIVAKSTLRKVCLVQIRGYLLSIRTSLLESVVVK